MKKHLITLLGLVAVTLFLAGPVAADPGGHGGGGGGHGRGWGGGDHGGGGGHGSGWSGGADHAAIGHAASSGSSHAALAPAYASHVYPHAVHAVGPMAYHHAYYDHWYHGDWHDHYHWDHPWHYGPIAWWSAGFVTGAIVWDTPWRWGYWPYYNPYCTEVVVVDNTAIDYSQPIVVVQQPAAQAAVAQPAAAQPAVDDQVAALMDQAHDAFARGDYASAMTLANQAIARKPNDTVPHEFRALVLFANKQYKEAAGAVYAVLSVGPGWDWATLSGFYPDVNVYTAQLRALEQYRNDNLKSPAPRFLLAYHYMSCGHVDAAVAELKEVVRLSPKDQLSAQLLAALSQKSDAQPAPIAAPAAPARPVDAAGLVGDWTLTRSDGATFSLQLNKDATFAWKYTQEGKSQEFSGAYTVADNLLILKQNGNPTMVGQAASLGPNQFNFKLVGNNPSDPGLTFSRK